LLPTPDSDPPPSAGPASVPPPSLPPAFLSLPDDLLSGMTLLVVDDEVDAREAIVSLLERYGARVHSAASVAEAMVALEAELPDVLITDLGMPEEDGFELIRRVRHLP